MFRFEKLDIWREANDYASHIYQLTQKFPRIELFGLSDQLRRAANSISTNIAEGSGSTSKKDFCHFLNISIRSLFETVSLVFRASQEKFITEKEKQIVYERAETLVKKITAFRKSLL